MKICMLSHTYPPEKLGGAEIYVQSLSNSLSAKGHEIVVITQTPYKGISSLLPRTDLEGKIKFYRFFPLNIFSIYKTQNKPYLLKGIWRLIDLINPFSAALIYNIIKKEKPDIIHCHILHGFSPVFLFLIFKITGIPVVHTLHSYGLFCLRCDLLKPSGGVCIKPHIFCRIFIKITALAAGKLPNTVISPSKFCLNMHKNNGLFKHSKNVILANGIDTPKDYPSKRHTVPGDNFNILYCGRVVKNKGIHLLIQAVKEIPDENLRLYIAGDGNYLNKLMSLSNGDKRIIFLGRLAYSELKEYYLSASVTVLPSLCPETFGMAIAESFACATPVIASRVGAIEELVKGEFNGYLFQAGNTEELRLNIEKALRDSAKLIQMGVNGFNTAKKLDIKNHLLELEKIYLRPK